MTMIFLLTLLLFSLEAVTAFVPATNSCSKIVLFSTAVENPLGEPASFVDNASEEEIKTIGNPQERSKAMPFLPRPMNLDGYVGDVGFDPWGFSDRYPVEFLREAELKHGRVATLAWFGWISVDLGLRIYPAPAAEWQASSSAEAFKNLSPGVAISAHPDGYWGSPFFQALVLIGLVEGYCTEDVNKLFFGEECDRKGGDVGFDVLNLLKDKSDAEVKRMKLRELKNVRLGMLAFFGVLVQSVVLGYDSFPYIPKDLWF